jgi:hypothetical protein
MVRPYEAADEHGSLTVLRLPLKEVAMINPALAALHSRAVSFSVSPLARPCLPRLLPSQRVLTQPTRSPPSKSSMRQPSWHVIGAGPGLIRPRGIESEETRERPPAPETKP